MTNDHNNSPPDEPDLTEHRHSSDMNRTQRIGARDAIRAALRVLERSLLKAPEQDQQLFLANPALAYSEFLLHVTLQMQFAIFAKLKDEGMPTDALLTALDQGHERYREIIKEHCERHDGAAH